MRRGAWHQFGDRSQRLAREQLRLGQGVGVIISPRDLARHNAIDYADDYRNLGAEVLFDPQFFIPDFTNDKMDSYSISQHRTSINSLTQVSESQLNSIASDLIEINGELQASAVLAPAVVYEAARADILDLNDQLFTAATTAADELGVPVYASVILGRSATVNSVPMNNILARATALQADGWYFAFQFNGDRIPSSTDDIARFGKANLALAQTGLPCLNAYVGPMGLLSFGFGAKGAAVGHFQNLWQFTPDRWRPSSASQGGGGDAPPRFFSTSLWGTIIYPDELVQLSQALEQRIVTPSPFSGPVGARPPRAWARWDANKHLVHSLCEALDQLASYESPLDSAHRARQILEEACEIIEDIADEGLQLRDDADAYQSNWLEALEQVLDECEEDYQYLELIGA